LLLVALFSHLALGLQVVIEDYVHSWVKIPALLAVRFACFSLGIAGNSGDASHCLRPLGGLIALAAHSN
jgi:hypothetical protein